MDGPTNQRIVGIDAMRCPLLFMLTFMHGPQIGRLGAAENLAGRATVHSCRQDPAP